MKKNQLHIYNCFGVMCKKLIKTTLKFRKSGNMRISLFFPGGADIPKSFFESNTSTEQDPTVFIRPQRPVFKCQ